MHQPNDAIDDTKMLLQRQRRQPGFRLADRVQAQELQCQEELIFLKDVVSDERNLMTAAVALEHLVRAAQQNAVRRLSATREDEPACWIK